LPQIPTDPLSSRSDAPRARRFRPTLVTPVNPAIVRRFESQDRMLRPAHRSVLRQLALALADCAGVLAAGVAVYVIGNSLGALLVTVASTPVWLAVAKAHGLYDADENKTWHLTTDELPRIFYAVTLSLALTWVVMSLVDVKGLGGGGALAAWTAAFVTSTSLRTLARAAWRRFVPSERSIVIGDGRSASRVIRKLMLERGHHLSVVAQISYEGYATGEALRDVITDTYAHRVIVAVDELDDPALTSLSSTCREEGVKLSVVPPLQSVLRSANRVHHVAELPMVELPTTGPSVLSLSAKRALDVGLSSVLLVVASPLFALLVTWVRLDSKGGAFFRQQRAGRYGTPFTMLKFRSMCSDAEDRLKEIVDIDQLTDPMFKIKADPRVTGAGRFLRAASLDELPQLWNVLRGDMSLVGPRPEDVRVVQRYNDDARAVRLAMKPGLTGPMQIHGRGELTFEERLEVERDYVEHYALRKDIGILARTGGAIFLRKGAY